MSIGAEQKLVVASAKYDLDSPISLWVGKRMAWIFERVADTVVMTEDRAGNQQRLKDVWPEASRSYASIYDHAPFHLVLTDHEQVTIGSEGITVMEADGRQSKDRADLVNPESLALALALDRSTIEKQVGVTAFYGAVLLEEFTEPAGTYVKELDRSFTLYQPGRPAA